MSAAVVVVMGACSSSPSAPATQTSDRTGRTTIAVVGTEVPDGTDPMSTTTIGRAALCAPFAAEVFNSVQAELDRLAAVPLDDYLADDKAGELSDGYYTRQSDVQATATAAGCERVDLARAVLAGGDGLRARGPVAGAAKAGIVDELAWRVGRASESVDGPVSVTVSVSGAAPPGVTRASCADVATGWLEVQQRLTDALAAVPVDRYVGNAALRSTDVREAGQRALEGDLPGLRFEGGGIATVVDELLRDEDRLGCTEEAIARVLVTRSEEIRSTSATGLVFAADQLDLSLLLLTGL